MLQRGLREDDYSTGILGKKVRVEKISAVVSFLFCNMCGMLCVKTMVDNDEDW